MTSNLRKLIAELSFKFKTVRTLEMLEDLTSRQFIMKILECLQNSFKYQLLNRRFYEGIHPHWFYRIEKIPLQIRLTAVTGISDARLNDF